MPCLNEAETVADCVQKARTYIESHGIEGEVLIADNGSTDGSQQLAVDAGARVVDVPTRGYGAALIAGNIEARGEFVIMGDADMSYDFSALDPFLSSLRGGADLVVGNRFRGGIEPGAMPPLHRYLGNPVLSGIGRVFFRSRIKDFHCGLRGYRRDAVLALNLQSPGMEFASEMVVRATLYDLRIEEVPTKLHPDGRSRPPHLRSWSDGWRHLRFLLLFSPRWLFFYPGFVLIFLGVAVGARLIGGQWDIGPVVLDVNTLLMCAAFALIGYQSIWFGVLSKAFASREGLLPRDVNVERLRNRFRLERALAVSAIGAIVASVIVALVLRRWANVGYGELELGSTMRHLIPAVALGIGSAQTALGSLMLSILALPSSRPSASIDRISRVGSQAGGEGRPQQ